MRNWFGFRGSRTEDRDAEAAEDASSDDSQMPHMPPSYSQVWNSPPAAFYNEGFLEEDTPPSYEEAFYMYFHPSEEDGPPVLSVQCPYCNGRRMSVAVPPAAMSVVSQAILDAKEEGVPGAVPASVVSAVIAAVPEDVQPVVLAAVQEAAPTIMLTPPVSPDELSVNSEPPVQPVTVLATVPEDAPLEDHSLPSSVLETIPEDPDLPSSSSQPPTSRRVSAVFDLGPGGSTCRCAQSFRNLVRQSIDAGRYSPSSTEDAGGQPGPHQLPTSVTSQKLDLPEGGDLLAINAASAAGRNTSGQQTNNASQQEGVNVFGKKWSFYNICFMFSLIISFFVILAILIYWMSVSGKGERND